MNKKKIILLALATLLGALSLWAYDKPAQGDGTSANPYLLTSSNDMMWFITAFDLGTEPNSVSARMVQDIDMTGYTIKYNTTSRYYKGTFDGGGFALKNVEAAGPLFNNLDDNAEIKNLTIASGNIVDAAFAMHADASSGTSGKIRITNCHNYANIMGSGYTAGGFVRAFRNVTFSWCSNHGNVSVKDTIGSKYMQSSGVGGLAGLGSEKSRFEYCYNEGTLGASNHVGAIVACAGTDSLISCWNITPPRVGSQRLNLDGDGYARYKNCCSLYPGNYSTQMTAEQFANGIATSFLDGGNGNVGWGQVIGTDPYPVPLKSDKSNAVYRVDYFYKQAYPTRYFNLGAIYPLPDVPPSASWDLYDNNVKTTATAFSITNDHKFFAMPQGMVYDNTTNTYTISKPAHLSYFSNIVNKRDNTSNAKVTAPLDMTGITDYEPIGVNRENKFNGNFDGGNYLISNLKVTSDALYVGLFGFAGMDDYNKTMKNIKLDATCEFHATKPAGVDTASYVGALAGYGYGLQLYNINSAAKVVQENDYKDSSVGGLVGFDYKGMYRSGIICSGDVTGTHYVGGFMGRTYPTSSYSSYVFEGYFNGTLTSTATSGDKWMGAIAGWASTRTGYEHFVANDEKCKLPYWMMGNNYSESKGITAADFESGYATYLLNAGNSTPLWGQVIGTDAMPQPSYNTANRVFRVAFVGDYNAEFYCNPNDAVAPPTVPGFNITYTKAGAAWAGETVNADITVNTKAVPTSCAFYNAADSTYAISTPANLEWVRAAIEKGVSGLKLKLQNDIDFSSVSNFAPIGSVAHPFSGRLLGEWHSFKNLKISASTGSVGFFAYTRNAVIKQLTIDSNSSITAAAGASHVGALIGMAMGCDTIMLCTMDGKVIQENQASCGGLVGAAGSTMLINCSRLNGDLNGVDVIGGFYGSCSSEKWAYYIKQSFMNGTITSTPVNASTMLGAYYGYIRQENPAAYMYSNGNKCALQAGYSFQYSDGYDVKPQPAAVMSTEELAQGKVTWGLNGNGNMGPWGQKIGRDALPYFLSGTTTDDLMRAGVLYSKKNLDGTLCTFNTPIAVDASMNETMQALYPTTVDELPTNYYVKVYISGVGTAFKANHFDLTDKYPLYKILADDSTGLVTDWRIEAKTITFRYHPQRYSDGEHGYNQFIFPVTGKLCYNGKELTSQGPNPDFFLKEFYYMPEAQLGCLSIKSTDDDTIHSGISYFMAIPEKYSGELTVECKVPTAILTANNVYNKESSVVRVSGSIVGFTPAADAYILDNTGDCMVPFSGKVPRYGMVAYPLMGTLPMPDKIYLVNEVGIPTGIGEASLATPSVRVIGGIGKITVEGTARDIAVYTISGAMVSRDRATISCAPGIYIVKVDGKSYKTIVR